MGNKADFSAKYISLNIVNQKVKQTKFLFFAVLLAFWSISSFLSTEAEAQRIPRAGYPYCQEFIGFNLDREEDLQPSPITLTGQSIQLTNASPYDSGYFYIDLPFFPDNGIQVSFEYLAYGGTGADGLTFFMFDGAYGNGPGFLPFGIGGSGGALGYAGRIQNVNDIINPGLTGGYLGLAFDVWGNYISKEFPTPLNRKPTGVDYLLSSPDSLGGPLTGPFPNTVGLRGPASTNYDFIDSLGVYKKFKKRLDTPIPNFTCPPDENYRKVFLSLQPKPGGYSLTVKMMLGTQIVTIFDNIDYNFVAPPTIKLGFAAATGDRTNNHEIRNLAVDIFEADIAKYPEVEANTFRTCEDQELEIELGVKLNSSIDDRAFIQCLEIFEDDLTILNDPTKTWNSPTFLEDHLVCGLTPICKSCQNGEFEIIKPGFGTFKVIVPDDLDIGNLDDDRVLIKFTPLPVDQRTSNTGSIYYTVTDNFGLTAQPARITVIINPVPEFVGDAVIDPPTCDGQNNGSISAVVKNLVQGFEHEWIYEDLTGSRFELGPQTVTGNVVNDGDEATFTINGISRGKYFLVVQNPLNDGEDGFCTDILEAIVVEDELGTPVEVDNDLFRICEGDEVRVKASIENTSIIPPGVVPIFIWYADADKNFPLITSSSTGPVLAPGPDGSSLSALPDGTLIIDGLVSNGGTFKEYEFFVEVKEDRTQDAQICEISGILEVAVRAIVYPSITFSPEVKEDDWCLENLGSISIQANRGVEPMTRYFLLDADQNPIRGPQTDGTFNGLSKGIYFVQAQADNPSCEAISGPIEIFGPDAPMNIAVDSFNPSCENNNGWIEWEVKEGNGNYSVVSITGYPGGVTPTVIQAGGTFRIDNLPFQDTFYTLTITFQDDKGCTITSSREIQPQILPVYSINNGEICIDEDITILPGIPVVGFPDPQTIFKWYSNAETTNEITTGVNAAIGATFDIDPATGRISISDFQTDATYTFWMKPEISNNCDVPAFPVTVQVNPLPSPIFEERDPNCFQAADGQLVLTGGGQSEYSYVLDGSSTTFNGTSFDGLVAGDYVIVATNNVTGCSIRLPFNLAQPELLVLEELDSVNPSCGLDNGQIEFRFSGGTGNYEVFLNNASIQNYTTAEAGQTFSINDLAGGDYILRIQDDNDCIQEFSFTLTPDDFPEFDVTNDVICEINAGDPSRPFYVATVSPVVINLSTAVPVYTWFYKDGAGTEVQINNGSTVFGATATINSNSELSLQGLSAASIPYEVFLKVTGDNVCDNSLIPATITVNPLPTPVFVAEDVSCFGESDGNLVLESGGAADYVYEIVNNSTAFDGTAFTDLPAGTYTIRVTNTLTSCFDNFVLTISQPDVLEIEEVELIDPTCDLDNGIYQFRIMGGTGPFEILLDGQAVEVYESGQSTPISSIDSAFIGKLLEIRNLAGGTFKVSLKDENSCEADAEFTLAPRDLPIFETESADICEFDPQTGNAVIATVRPVVVEISNAVPIYTWYYLDPAGAEVQILNGSTVFGATASINGASELSLQGLAGAADPYTVYLKVTGDFVCDNSLIPAEILVSPLPDPVLEGVDVTCFDGNDGRIELVSGGSADFEYEFSDPTVSFDATAQAFIDLSAGNYTITVTNTITGCFDTFDFEIQEPDALILSEERGIDATCGQENGEIFFRADGGTGPYSIFVNDLPIEVYQFFLGATGTYNVRGLAPGTYSVRVEDANGCAEEELNWITLQNNEGETVTAIPDEVTVCEGTPAILKPTVTVSGGVTPVLTWYLDSELTLAIAAGVNPNGIEFILPPDGSMEVRGLPVGNYEYFVGISGQNVCTNSSSGTIEVLEPVSADVVATDIICFGDENGSIQVTNVSGGNSDFEYSLNETTWQDAPLFENLAPGTYTVYVRDKTLLSDCALELPGVEVKSPIGPIISNTPQIFAESCESANGEIFGLEISGGWGNYTHEWRKDNPTNGAVITGTITGIENAEAGTYYLLIEDEKGCSEVFEYLIGTAPDPQYILLDPIDVCEGNPVTLAPLHVAINPNTPTARTDVSWYKGPNQTGLIQDGVDSVNPEVSYSIDDSDWLNPKLIVTGLVPGTYTYYFFVECTGVEMPISVTVYPTPAVVIEVSRETCVGENDGKISVISGHQAGYIYSIGQEDLTLAQLESRNFAGGSYSIEVITAEGCNQLLTAEIEASTALKLDLQDSKNAACGLADGFIEVELTGGWAPYTVELTEVNSSTKTTLSGTDSIYKFENLSQGTYTVTVTDAEQCSQALSNQVTVEDGPSEVLLEDEYFICEGEDLELRPGVNPTNTNAQFNWYLNSVSVANKLSDGQTVNGAQLSINANGTIFRAEGLTPSNDLRLIVTVEGPGICVGDEHEVLLRVLTLPEVTASKVDEICFGDLGQIVLNPSVSSGALQYSVNGGTFQTYPNNIIDNLAQGSYQIQVRNLANCIVDLPAINIEGPDAILQVQDYGNIGASCEEDNGIIFGEVSGGEAPYLIQIRRAGQLLQNPVTWEDNKFQITDLALGTYEIILADSRGCEITLGSSTITDEPTPIEVNSVVICEGEIAILTPFIPGVPSSPGYRWYKDVSKTRQIPLGSSQENGVGYELGANGVLRINSLPANGSPYSYFVELNLAATCDTKLGEANVVVNPLPNLRTFNPSIVCDPTETVNLTNFIDNFNASIYDYEVIAPSGTALRLDQISTVSQIGTYLVRSKFKNSSCWTGQERILVRIAGEEIIANFDYQLDLGSGNILTNLDIGIEELVQFIDISVGNAVAWEWDFGDGTTSTLQNPVHEYKEKGTYIIRLTIYSEIGCISVIERTVNVFDDYLIMFPNAFTPTRTDGKNNVFYPKFRGIASLKLYIFNTWGELIYLSESFEQGGWDGYLNGQPVQNGNYVYKAEFTTRGGLKGSEAGVFILVK